MSDMIIDYGCCDNCEHKDPDAKECAHGKPTRGIYGLLRCENWAAKKEAGKCCNNCGLYNPDTKICKVHKVRIYNNDVDTWHCSYWEDKNTLGNKVIQAGLQNPDTWIVKSLSGALHRHCGNCKYHNKHDSMCPEGHATHGDSCKNWEPDEEKIEQEKPIEKRCSNCGSCHRKEAVALDRGVQQGGTLEMLDTVFDIACQQVPACSERWTKLKTHIHYMLCRKWAEEDMPK